MIALAAGELRRVLARRMVRVLALLAVLGIALAGVLTFLNTEAVSSADLAGRRQAADARVAACLAGGSLPQLQGRDAPPPGDRRTENFCRFVVGKVDDPRFKLRSVKGIPQGTTGGLVVVAWLIGASVIATTFRALPCSRREPPCGRARRARTGTNRRSPSAPTCVGRP